MRAAHTTDGRVNSALRLVGASSAEALLDGVPAARIAGLSPAAGRRLGPQAVDLTRLYVMNAGDGAADAARRLRATPGVAFAEPDFYVSPMDTNPVPLPGWVAKSAARMRRRRPAAAARRGLTGAFDAARLVRRRASGPLRPSGASCRITLGWRRRCSPI